MSSPNFTVTDVTPLTITNRLSQPHVISDQLKNFFVAMLGDNTYEYTVYENKVVTTKNGRDMLRRIPVKNDDGSNMTRTFSAHNIEIISSTNISLSSINTQLFALYTRLAKTASQTNSTRFHVTPLMEEYFGKETNCHWIYDGTDLGYSSQTALLSREELLHMGVPENKVDTFYKNVTDMDLPALDRLYKLNYEAREGTSIINPTGDIKTAYVRQRSGKEYRPYIMDAEEGKTLHDINPKISLGGDDYGIMFSMFMILSAYFRIPTYILERVEFDTDELRDPTVIAQLEQLQSELQNMIQTYRDAEVRTHIRKVRNVNPSKGIRNQRNVNRSRVVRNQRNINDESSSDDSSDDSSED
jgi:hypothetical protein